MKVLGFRFGNMAYVTDIKTYPDSLLDELKSLDILVLSALRFGPSHMHFTVDDAVAFVKKIAPKKTYLTHIAHELDHEKTNDYLQDGIELAYDGLEFTYDG
jgi:phosphoribosyl 1,2-cyclic phosphate phosphodiesterase